MASEYSWHSPLSAGETLKEPSLFSDIDVLLTDEV